MKDSAAIKNLRSAMETIDKIVKYLPEKRETKTIPSIFNKESNENFISDFLAYLLDPLQNGIGIEPLYEVVNAFSNKAGQLLQSLTLAERNCIKVFREFTFSDRRRIDILIVVEDKLVIGIEHKIYSQESEKQTDDYATGVQTHFPTSVHVLLYLTPAGHPPRSEDFQAISYSQLIERLKTVKYDYRDDIRKKVIYDEFILHVEEYFMSNKTLEISDQTKLYLEYQDTISKLLSHFNEDSLKVFEQFECILKSTFSEKDWIYNIKPDRSWHTVYKKSWDTPGLFIHHEFWISTENILSRDNMYHIIEIEGKNKDIFLAMFDKEYAKIKDQYDSNGIEFRPDVRKRAIAYRVLDNYFCPSYAGENKLLEELNKCSFIEEAIERVYREYVNTIR